MNITSHSLGLLVLLLICNQGFSQSTVTDMKAEYLFNTTESEVVLGNGSVWESGTVSF